MAELYGDHGRMVLALCRMFLRDLAEAEDAAQQAFLSAYRSLLAGNEPEHPAAWLATKNSRQSTRPNSRRPTASGYFTVSQAA